MNREQMIAWLTLEGWAPYNTPELCTIDGNRPYDPVLSKDGLNGLPPERSRLTWQPLRGDDVPIPWNKVNTKHIESWVYKLEEYADEIGRLNREP